MPQTNRHAVHSGRLHLGEVGFGSIWFLVGSCVQRIHLSTRRRPTPVSRTMALALRPLKCNARTLANSSFLALHRSATSCLLWVCTSGFAREQEAGTGTG